MVFSLIKRIRRQPKGSRDTIALSIAVGFTAVIAVAWVVQVPGQVIQNIPDDPVEATAFTTLFSGVSDQFSEMQASVASVTSSSTLAASADQMVVDDALYAEEIKYFALSASTTATSSAPELPPVLTGQVVRIATTSGITTSSSSVVY